MKTFAPFAAIYFRGAGPLQRNLVWIVALLLGLLLLPLILSLLR